MGSAAARNGEEVFAADLAALEDELERSRAGIDGVGAAERSSGLQASGPGERKEAKLQHSGGALREGAVRAIALQLVVLDEVDACLGKNANLRGGFGGARADATCQALLK
ncbi:MAG TPA: hypothetical protein VHY48_05945 [Acidobacteriaceae bacterium]|nr:hypothetical protein [Acidobacteriaceae bacterium]